MSAALALPIEPEPSIRVEAAAFVLALRGRGVSDLALLRAMEKVPRELFAPRRYADLARQDVALPLPCGETMTAPSVVGQMLSALAIRPGHRVLEVGTGSGYVSALLVGLGALVQTAERQPALADSAGERLRALGLAGACDLVAGDGLAGAGGGTRFDRILLNGAVPALSPGLTSRLAAGGRLVCGHVAESGATRLAVVERGQDGRLSTSFGAAMRLGRLVVPPSAPRATEA